MLNSYKIELVTWIERAKIWKLKILVSKLKTCFCANAVSSLVVKILVSSLVVKI